MRIVGPVIASAALFVLSFPNFSIWPLSFVCLVPFFIALNRAVSLRGQAAIGAAWGAVMSAGMGWWLVGTLMGHFEKGPVVSVLFVAAVMAVPTAALYAIFAVIHHTLKKNTIFFSAVMVPSIWTAVEYIKEMVPFLLPWAGIGYAVTPFNAFIQMADTAGYYGVTFVIVMINSLIAYSLRSAEWREIFSKNRAEIPGRLKKTASDNRLPLSIAAAALLVPLLYGAVFGIFFRDRIETGPKPDAIEAVLVQGNLGDRERWADSGLFGRIETHLGLMKDYGRTGRTLFVLPETVLNSTGQENNALLAYISSRSGDDSVVFIGGIRRDRATGGVLNTAYVLSGKELTCYDKNILLPYAETIMGGDFIGKYYNAPSEFLEGATPPAVRTGFGNAGVCICFEVLYPWHVRRAVSEGALYLVNISNDSWFGRSPESAYQVSASVMRAVENRRYLARTSNSGISVLVSPSGRVIAETGLFTREARSGRIFPVSFRSPYSRLGDWVLYLGLLSILAGLVRRAFRE
ncbi:MAG: apolipoprotein N-acyltransferase [Spirochaetes bacterium]|nr:apolipoprotein N-acyltransferase [Spirochaetota bacterium]